MPYLRPRLDLGVALALCTGVVHPAAAQAPASGRDLLLDVVLNGVDTETVGAFVERQARLYASPTEVEALGLAIKEDYRAQALVDLSALDGIEADIDERAQTLRLTATVAALATHTLDFDRTRSASRSGSNPVGVLINYDATATTANGGVNAYDLTSARLFGPFGVLQNDAILTHDRSGTRILRLGTSYSFSDPGRLRSYTAGDLTSGALASTRSIRLAGIQVSTNFALKPDLITYPVPVVSGGAVVPSTVDVLVNGVRQLSAPVAPGPFYVPQLPVVTGAGEISVATRDAAGHQTLQTSSFYASPALLEPGLSSFSLETGAIRRNSGSKAPTTGRLPLPLRGGWGSRHA